jgi:AcrR family transcriptional regulator
MPAIAHEAGVVVETIYRIFGNKSGLFRAVVEALLAGGPTRAEVPVEERPAIRAIIDEPDPRRKIALYAATQPGIHRRAGPLLSALRGAKASNRDLARLWDELEAWRYEGQGRLVAQLAERGGLRADRSLDEAKDVVWTLCSLAVHDLLVLERGWTAERYEAWLAATLTHELVGD